MERESGRPSGGDDNCYELLDMQTVLLR